MEIRRATRLDAEAVHKVHGASIRELCSAHYSPEQIGAWVGALRPERYLSAIETLDFLVAEAERVVGFCILDAASAELNALYVDPVMAGQGVGRRLLAAAEEMASRRSVAVLGLKSTLNAATFYEACGFSRLGEATHVNPAGLELPCIQMSKRLAVRPARPGTPTGRV